MLYSVSTPDQRCTERQEQEPVNEPNWNSFSFEVVRLSKEQQLQQQTLSNEVCLTIVSGQATISTSTEKWSNIGESRPRFEQKAPYCVYIPPDDHFVIESKSSDLAIAVCKVPAQCHFPARLITPGAETTMSKPLNGSNASVKERSQRVLTVV